MAAGSPSWQPQRPRRLADDGGLLARGGRPEARITEPTLRAYIGHLRAGCASTSVASAIGILGMTIQAMAP